MGLGNKAQAVLMAFSLFCISIGAAGATIPNWLPEDIKYYFAGAFWFLGILGVALKESLGGQPPKQEN